MNRRAWLILIGVGAAYWLLTRSGAPARGGINLTPSAQPVGADVEGFNSAVNTLVQQTKDNTGASLLEKMNAEIQKATGGWAAQLESIKTTGKRLEGNKPHNVPQAIADLTNDINSTIAVIRAKYGL